jgi:hypothetical protein
LEREKNIKYKIIIYYRYVINAIGGGQLPYWLGTFLFDFITYLIPFSLMIFVSIGDQFLSKYLQKLFTIMFFFGISLVWYSYAWSFFFKLSNTAFKNFPIINYFLFFSLPLVLIGKHLLIT